MKTKLYDAPGIDRNFQIETALADYPNVDAETLAKMIDWFRSEASALDVGMIASDPRLGKHYQQFKADHLDRLKGVDLFWAAVFVAIAGCCISLMIWLA